MVVAAVDPGTVNAEVPNQGVPGCPARAASCHGTGLTSPALAFGGGSLTRRRTTRHLPTAKNLAEAGSLTSSRSFRRRATGEVWYPAGRRTIAAGHTYAWNLSPVSGDGGTLADHLIKKAAGSPWELGPRNPPDLLVRQRTCAVVRADR